MSEDTAWSQMIADFDAGQLVEMDEETWYYWLEALPPVYMDRVVAVGGKQRRVSFGFAEGCEPIRAFWREKQNGLTRYFGQRTTEVHHG